MWNATSNTLTNDMNLTDGASIGWGRVVAKESQMQIIIKLNYVTISSVMALFNGSNDWSAVAVVE